VLDDPFLRRTPVKRPIAFLALSFLFGTTVFVASHLIAESRADAAIAQQPPQGQLQPPEQQRPAQTPAQQPETKQPEKRVDNTAKPELMSRHNEAHAEIHDPAKRKELCRRLEQRRQELRHEQEAQAQRPNGSGK
jgi:hypothetical protein